MQFYTIDCDEGGDKIDREIYNQGYAEHSFLVQSNALERGEEVCVDFMCIYS